MSSETRRFDTPRMRLMLGVIVPIGITALVYFLDYLDGPRTTFAGIVTCVGFMAAIFGGPRATAFVVAIVTIGAYFFGLTSEDAGTLHQIFRLVLVAIAGAAAVFYSSVRIRREKEREALAHEKVELENSSKLALFDQLTGIFNRRGVIEALENEDRWPRSVTILDLDRLKNINDTFGHSSGDDFIQIVSQRILRAVSAKDICGRWGGDEFIVILPLAKAQATKVMARVIAQVSGEPIAFGKVKIEPRLSGGVAEWMRTDSLEHTLVLADSALYEAKHSGGNQLIAHHADAQLLGSTGQASPAV